MSRVKVVRVDVDDGLPEIPVEDRYQRVLLVVTSGGAFVGQLMVRAKPILTVDAQWTAILNRLGMSLWRECLKRTFLEAAQGPVDRTPRRAKRVGDRLYEGSPRRPAPVSG